jgi:hypothetical protein
MSEELHVKKVGTDNRGRDIMHVKNKTPFVLSNEPWKPPKRPSKDILEATYDEAWSEMRSEFLHGRKVFYFHVENMSTGSEYSTELFEGLNGEPCAVCICPSAVPCKHIKNCVRKVISEIDPTFGEQYHQTDWMLNVGLEDAPF